MRDSRKDQPETAKPQWRTVLIKLDVETPSQKPQRNGDTQTQRRTQSPGRKGQRGPGKHWRGCRSGADCYVPQGAWTAHLGKLLSAAPAPPWSENLARQARVHCWAGHDGPKGRGGKVWSNHTGPPVRTPSAHHFRFLDTRALAVEQLAASGQILETGQGREFQEKNLTDANRGGGGK